MKLTYFKANFTIAHKAKKNILLVSFLIIFSVLFLFVVELQRIGDGAVEWQAYNQSLDINMDYFDNSSLRKKTYRATYNNLSAQKASIALIQNSEVFNSPKDYLQSMTNLNEEMLKGYRTHYRGAYSLVVPPKFELQQRLVTYRYLARHKIPIVMNDKSSATYVIYLLSIFGIFMFFYLLLLAADSWMMNLNHPTLLKNIPYLIRDEIRGKIAINLVLTLVPLIVAVILAYLFAGLRNSFSSLSYPVVFYLNKISAIALWQYFLIFLLYTIAFGIFITCLAMFLNQLLKNVYLTILVGSVVYVLSFLPGKILRYLCFLPSAYVNIGNVLSGTIAKQTGLSYLNAVSAIVILLLWAGTFALLFRWSVGRVAK